MSVILYLTVIVILPQFAITFILYFKTLMRLYSWFKLQDYKTSKTFVSMACGCNFFIFVDFVKITIQVDEIGWNFSEEHFPTSILKLQVSRVENATCTFSQQSINAASCSRKPGNMEMYKIKLTNFSSVSRTFHVLSNGNPLVLSEAAGEYFSFNQTRFIVPRSCTHRFFNSTSLQLSSN